MKHGRTLHLLLTLAFALGQWFAVVHGTQHELNGADKLVACEICAVGHASAAPPSAATLTVSFFRNTEAPVAQPAAAPQRKPLYRPPTRGPPAILV